MKKSDKRVRGTTDSSARARMQEFSQLGPLDGTQWVFESEWWTDNIGTYFTSEKICNEHRILLRKIFVTSGVPDPYEGLYEDHVGFVRFDEYPLYLRVLHQAVDDRTRAIRAECGVHETSIRAAWREQWIDSQLAADRFLVVLQSIVAVVSYAIENRVERVFL